MRERKDKYCIYCGEELEDYDKLEGCCNGCADKQLNGGMV